MKCRIHFYLLNEHFSVEHADANHDGEESEMNRKYEWEDELNVPQGVDSIKMVENTTYILKGFKGEEEFSYEVPKMRIFELHLGESVSYIGCSESILEEHQLVEEEGQVSIKIFIKDYEPMSNPVSGIFIASQEFPKELIEV